MIIATVGSCTQSCSTTAMCSVILNFKEIIFSCKRHICIVWVIINSRGHASQEFILAILGNSQGVAIVTQKWTCFGHLLDKKPRVWEVDLRELWKVALRLVHWIHTNKIAPDHLFYTQAQVYRVLENTILFQFNSWDIFKQKEWLWNHCWQDLYFGMYFTVISNQLARQYILVHGLDHTQHAHLLQSDTSATFLGSKMCTHKFCKS